MDENFQWSGRSVLVTGHTGFKGAWLALWLHKLGAKVHGFSLPESPSPAACTALGVSEVLASETLADLRDARAVAACLKAARPEMVFHLAAQSLVRESYRHPLETLQTNVMGTAHVLEALRTSDQRHACLVVTSDKCYENSDGAHVFTEADPLGGSDLYSMSKGACELLVAAYRRSFFSAKDSRTFVASARAGNVIGGGDYALERLIPDCVRALAKGERIILRNPSSVRPWQHVLEPLSGYLTIAERLLGADPTPYCEGWNFGPRQGEVLRVSDVTDAFVAAWGSGVWHYVADPHSFRESETIQLAVGKASEKLDWSPTWTAARAISETASWYKRFEDKPKAHGCMRDFSLKQIETFSNG